MELHDIVLPRSERWLCSWMSHPQLTSKGVSYCTCKIRQPYSSLKTTWPARCTEWEACRYRLDTECLPQTLRIQPLGPAGCVGRLQWLAGSLEKGFQAFWPIWYLLALLYTHMFLPHSPAPLDDSFSTGIGCNPEAMSPRWILLRIPLPGVLSQLWEK